MRNAVWLSHAVQLRDFHGMIIFHDTLYALANRAASGIGDTIPDEVRKRMAEQKIKRAVRLAILFSTRKHAAASLLQAAWRGYKARGDTDGAEDASEGHLRLRDQSTPGEPPGTPAQERR